MKSTKSFPLVLPLFLIQLLWPAHFSSAATNSVDRERLEYNLKTTLDAYEKVGIKDPKWDAEAKKVLTVYVNMISSTNSDWEEAQTTLQKSLSNASLTDPLIRYLHARFVYSEAHTPEETAALYSEIWGAMKKSEYPEVRKYLVAMRTRNAIAAVKSRRAQAAELLDTATALLAKALEDKSMPVSEADEDCRLLMWESGLGDASVWKCYSTLEPVLTNHWSNASFAWLMRGKSYIAYAWSARGNGYANTVSDNGWKLMGERLNVAAQALETAWRLNPQDPRICYEMMTVELGQGQGRERMELWFNRGMKISPSNYDLCYQKLEYLRPRWYGSAEEMIAFGRECTMNTNWSYAVRLMLPDAYNEVTREIQDADKRAAYWKQPAVWKDIKMSFDQFFKLYPDEVGYRHNYAWYAAQCGKWQVFSDQIKMFPSTNYQYFGGVDAYNNMLHTMEVELKKH